MLDLKLSGVSSVEWTGRATETRERDRIRKGRGRSPSSFQSFRIMVVVENIKRLLVIQPEIMESFRFNHNNNVAYALLFSPVNDPGKIKQRIIDAAKADDQDRDAVNFSFIEASLVISIH